MQVVSEEEARKQMQPLPVTELRESESRCRWADYRTP
jgi:hypothetical protein